MRRSPASSRSPWAFTRRRPAARPRAPPLTLDSPVTPAPPPSCSSCRRAAAVAIVVTRLPAGSSQWTRPAVVSRQADRSNQNPVLVYDRPSGALSLLHTSQVAFRGQGTSEVLHLHSSDGGATWSRPEPYDWPHGAFVRNAALPARLAGKAVLLLPMYYTPDGFFEHSSQFSAVRRSFDGGRTWPDEVEMAGTRGRLVQPTVVRLRDGRLKAFFRDRRARSVFTSESSDEGRSWTPPERTPFPNNNSGIAALALRDGRLLLVLNNVRGRAHRWPLSVALSADDGRTWPYIRDLEPDYLLAEGILLREEDGEYRRARGSCEGGRALVGGGGAFLCHFASEEGRRPGSDRISPLRARAATLRWCRGPTARCTSPTRTAATPSGASRARSALPAASALRLRVRAALRGSALRRADSPPLSAAPPPLQVRAAPLPGLGHARADDGAPPARVGVPAAGRGS